MKRQNKKSKQELISNTVLLTAIINLIKALIELINKLNE